MYIIVPITSSKISNKRIAFTERIIYTLYTYRSSIDREVQQLININIKTIK